MLFELIAVGSWIFWALVGLAFLLEFISVGKEIAWPTILIPIIFVAIISVFGSFSPWGYVKANYIALLWGLGIYVAGACIWATVKWYNRSIKRGKLYASELENWAGRYLPEGVKITSINDIPMEKRMQFFRDLKGVFHYFFRYEESENWGSISCNDEPHYSHGSSAVTMKAELEDYVLKVQKEVLKKVLSSPKENKERITVWMIAWPISVLTTLVFDFLYDFFGWLRKSLAGLFTEISRMAFGKYRKDFDSIKVDKEI